MFLLGLFGSSNNFCMVVVPTFFFLKIHKYNQTNTTIASSLLSNKLEIFGAISEESVMKTF